MCTLQWRLKKIKDVDWLIATREIECHFGPGGFKASQEVVEEVRTIGPCRDFVVEGLLRYEGGDARHRMSMYPRTRGSADTATIS